MRNHSTSLLRMAMKIIAIALFCLCLANNGYSQDSWNEIAKVHPTPYLTNKDDNYGFAVDIGKDYIVVGAHGYDHMKGCAYVVSNDGTYSTLAKLTASDGDFNDFFGYSVCIGDSVIVIGAYGDEDRGNASGSVYIFAKPDDGWADMTETLKLTASDGSAFDFFGKSVAINGNTIIVGAEGEDHDSIAKGSVYIFEKEGSDWTIITEKAKLIASDGINSDNFGYSIAIDDSTIVVGCNTIGIGSAYVYQKPASGWINTKEIAKLTASDGALYDYFGTAVDIEDSIIVVGAKMDGDKGNYSGSVYLFKEPDTGWTDMMETCKLTASDGAANDKFGNSVKTSGDVIIVGAFPFEGTSDSLGSVYVFSKPVSGWETMNETAKLTASTGLEDDCFGTAISIYDSVIISGAYKDYENGQFAGTAYIFKQSATGWTNSNETKKLLPILYFSNEVDYFGSALAMKNGLFVIGSEYRMESSVDLYRICNDQLEKIATLSASDGAPNNHFGYSVCMSDNLIAVGAKYENIDGSFSDGLFYLFEMPPDGWADMTETAKLEPSNDSHYNYFNNSISMDDSIIVIGAWEDYFSNGSVQVYVKPGTGWENVDEPVKLSASDGAQVDYFGYSVSLYKDVIVVGAVQNNNQGSAYVYEKPFGGWETMTQTAKLIASDGNLNDFFGLSVDVYDSIIVVGAHGDDDKGNNSGSVYLFKEPGTGWKDMTETCKLTASDGTMNDGFGYTVSMDNNTIVVGLSYFPGINAFSSVYVFEKPVTGWEAMTETSILKPSEGNYYDRFGSSFDIYDNLLVIGAKGDDDSGINSGAAYIFKFGTNTFPTDTMDIVTCDSYLSPSGKYTWAQSGVYYDTLTNTGGCDSILIIQLSINKSESSFSVYTCEPYTSPSGKHTWPASGTYHDTIPNDKGCDSVMTIILTVSNSYQMEIDTTICEGESYFAGGANQTTSGTYYDTLPNATGCDTIITTHLSVEVCTGQISSNLDDQISIFPNPTKGLVNIECGDFKKIELFTLTGILINTIYEKSFDLSNYCSGIYLLRIVDREGNCIMEKVTVNK